jgi:amino-acid N-acetyltransferase
MLIIRRAVQQDLTPIRKLLQNMELHDQGMEDHLSHFFVAEYLGEHSANPYQPLIGVMGMEVYAPYALLRSFVVERTSWNRKVGLQMMQILLSYADHLKLSHVYLLAGESLPFFERIGFTAIGREQLPENIYDSLHQQRSDVQSTPMMYTCWPIARQH